MTKISREDLLTRYEAGERRFRDVDLVGVDLIGANLSGADLGGADLGGANLTEATLSRVNLSQGNLSEAQLERVNLSGANLSKVCLRFTGLINCDLSGANLDGAELYGERTWIEGCNCDGATFRNAMMMMIHIVNSTFRNAIFDGFVWGGDSGLTDVDLTRASFINSDLFTSSGSLTVARSGKIIFSDGKEVVFPGGSS